MNIRKIVFSLLVLALALMTVSCGEKVTFDQTLLYGKWENHGVFEKYYDNGTGATWDTNDDVTEEEAQPFDWTLDGTLLLQEHKLFNGTIVPKRYTMTKLTPTQLEYHDDYGAYYSFVKR